MTQTDLFITESAVFFVFIFMLFVILRQILFYGFAPFFPSSPETMEKILERLRIEKKFTIFSFGHGRSGFLRAVERKYPGVKLIGVEENSLHCLIARLQIFLHRSRIKIIRSDYYRVKIKDANIVYCHLDAGILRDIYKKLRLEPRSGAVIISSGFIVPYLEHQKILKTESKKRWYNFLVGKQEKILTEKEKEFKPDNNIYFYEV